jgi:hypothetical protein
MTAEPIKIGMLWYDNSPKTTIMDKIDEARQYYEEKFGFIPNLCFVHPTMTANWINQPPNHVTQEGIGYFRVHSVKGDYLIKNNTMVLPNHFWIGDTPFEEQKIT